MTMPEFASWIQAKQKEKSDEQEFQLLQMRYLACQILNSNPYRKRAIRPDQLFKLPSEQAQKKEVPSIDQIKKILKRAE